MRSFSWAGDKIVSAAVRTISRWKKKLLSWTVCLRWSREWSTLIHTKDQQSKKSIIIQCVPRIKPDCSISERMCHWRSSANGWVSPSYNWWRFLNGIPSFRCYKAGAKSPTNSNWTRSLWKRLWQRYHCFKVERRETEHYLVWGNIPSI